MTLAQQAWSARNEVLSGLRGLRFAIAFESRPAGFTQVLHGLQNDAGFRAWFNALLVDVPFTAFRWETPPVTIETLSRPFEFVVLDSPDLAGHPDPEAFAEHFGRTESDVIVFPNLGRDATMIVPCPIHNATAYAHLAAFVRLAPVSQRDALWQSVGETLNKRVGARPVWLNTAGGGVAWLHVRLDDRPKYYGYAPYRQLADTPA